MSPREAESRRRQIMAEVAKVGLCLPGSLVQRTTRCGSKGCACHTGPEKLHGPYPSWTRRVAGKTVTRTLSPEQAERYKPLFDNSRRLKELVEELEALSVRVVSEAEGWAFPPTAHATSATLQRTVSTTTLRGQESDIEYTFIALQRSRFTPRSG